ncbi:MAG: N-acetylmuramoyl-L-alanine amidase [Paracoccaceae bacterium]|nr:MAG: N-acetylmuramoyl-L-alanine amidase [Paracoccaceae bacterium]
MSVSPNCGPRRGGARPDLVVIHFTAMATAAAARARLCDPGAEVSAHWLIDAAGQAECLVPEDLRAWHAGAGQWGAVTDVNSRSIGIELANDGRSPFAAPQMRGLEAVLRGVMDRWGIPPERVIGHSDMAPERKSDPGARFDWRGLARAGLSVWPVPGMPGDFRADAAAFGYPPVAEAALLRAFRLRFRPWGHGPLCDADRAVAAGLRAWPGPGA